MLSPKPESVPLAPSVEGLGLWPPSGGRAHDYTTGRSKPDVPAWLRNGGPDEARWSRFVEFTDAWAIVARDEKLGYVPAAVLAPLGVAPATGLAKPTSARSPGFCICSGGRIAEQAKEGRPCGLRCGFWLWERFCAPAPGKV